MGPCCQTRPGKANRSKTNIPCVQLPVMAISPIRQRHVVLPAIHLDLDSGQSGFWLAIARRQRRVLAFRYEDHRRASGLTLRSAAKAECKDSTRTELWSTSCSPSRASSRFTAMIGGSWKGTASNGADALSKPSHSTSRPHLGREVPRGADGSVSPQRATRSPHRVVRAKTHVCRMG